MEPLSCAAYTGKYELWKERAQFLDFRSQWCYCCKKEYSKNLNKTKVCWKKILYWEKSIETQIAKAEPTIKPKKKVAKKAKEEVKPEDEDIDNDPPVIEIAEAITVNDSNYEIEGKVSDKGSDKIYVKVDGRNVVVKKGKFKIKRYSPVDEQIEIVAIDQWGNKSKPKLVNITIDIQETVVVEKLEPLNPSKIRSKSSNNKVALILVLKIILSLLMQHMQT